MSTHRLCCCGPGITCEEWCECGSGNLRVSFTINQRLRSFADANISSEVVEQLVVTNARLAWDATLCRYGAIGGAGNGTWSFTRTYTGNTSTPNGFEPSCPHSCKDPYVFCQSQAMAGTGNITTDSILIRCSDPCAEQFGTSPVDEHLLLEINVVAGVTVTETVAPVCVPALGTPPPPYPLNLILEGYFIAELECLDIHSFDTRGLRWPMIGTQFSAVDTCKGENNPNGWTCVGGFGTPIRVIPNYESSAYAKTCSGFCCVDGHTCFEATPPYAPTFACTCGDPNNPGPGSGLCYMEWTRDHTVSLQIP